MYRLRMSTQGDLAAFPLVGWRCPIRRCSAVEATSPGKMKARALGGLIREIFTRHLRMHYLSYSRLVWRQNTYGPLVSMHILCLRHVSVLLPLPSQPLLLGSSVPLVTHSSSGYLFHKVQYVLFCVRPYHQVLFALCPYCWFSSFPVNLFRILLPLVDL